MAAAVLVRPAEAADHPAILAVVEGAFSAGGREPLEEVAIVRDTWAREAAAAGLELVAVAGGEIVGHVLGAWGALDGRPLVGVAPLAVAPAHQGRGIGTALMRELLAHADAGHLPLVVLLGNPRYYERFGFEPAAGHGVSYAPVGEGNPHFQVCRLSADDPSWRGSFTYCWELPAP